MKFKLYASAAVWGVCVCGIAYEQFWPTWALLLALIGGAVGIPMRAAAAETREKMVRAMPRFRVPEHIPHDIELLPPWDGVSEVSENECTREGEGTRRQRPPRG